MSEAPAAEPASQKPLLLWPGVLIVALQWAVRYVVPKIAPEALLIAVLGGFVGTVLLLVWWLFFSRAPWVERLGAVALMVAGLFLTPHIIDESIRTGMMGLMFYMYATPVLCLALVAWAVATRHMNPGPRRAAMVASFAFACGVFALLRTDGISSAGSHFAWRWSETAEDRLLAQDHDEPPPAPSRPDPTLELVEAPADEPEAVSPAAAPVGEPVAEEAEAESVAPPATTETAADWPGFRGAHRDGHVPGVRIATDWSASPPVELWRRPIGPGWSSFAVDGERIYTQEQRGDDEVVTCYKATTGEPVWRHRDPARFWEANAGAGPRGTPTLSGGRLYSFGATGLLNAFGARTGAVVWTANVASDTGLDIPQWGFSSSPLVVDDLVVVAAAGQLVAYDRTTGEKRWTGSEGGGSYSSPHLVTLDGVPQILFSRFSGAMGVAPADGALLWEHPWPEGSRIVQPAFTESGDVLISAGEAKGLRRIAVARGPDGWRAEERWTSIRLKPYQSDFVVHEDHAYGFDGPILACIDIENGDRQWKGGRYGNGQLVLLPDQDVLLVTSEDGDLALVEAVPDRFTELARVPAMTGKTWNHPVLVGDRLLARNAQEMVAYRLTLADD